jgi:hypothetical protein
MLNKQYHPFKMFNTCKVKVPLSGILNWHCCIWLKSVETIIWKQQNSGHDAYRFSSCLEQTAEHQPTCAVWAQE